MAIPRNLVAALRPSLPDLERRADLKVMKFKDPRQDKGPTAALVMIGSREARPNRAPCSRFPFLPHFPPFLSRSAGIGRTCQ